MATGFDTATLRPTIHPWVMLAPLLFLPTAVLLFGNTWPAWVLMWALAFALYVGFKWLALSEFASRDGVPRWPRIAGFLILWPGMDADAFFDAKANVPRPPL